MSSDQLYSIRNLARADGYQAIWGFPTEDGIWIERWPLDYVAVRDVMVQQDGQWEHLNSEIVGVELVNGTFSVTSDLPCVYGIVRENATHEECADLLPSHLRSRVIEPESPDAKLTVTLA